MADQYELRERRDAEEVALPDALSAHGVELDGALEARKQLEHAAAYLELHIEQGPVLESIDLPLGVVLGTFGVERHQVTFTGQAAHAGSTPRWSRSPSACSTSATSRRRSSQRCSATPRLRLAASRRRRTSK